MNTKPDSFERLSASKSSRLRRIESALAGCLPCAASIEGVKATEQVSASICKVKGIEVLVSYLTPVAFRHVDGSCVAVTRGFYSRTTTRSQDAFSRSCVYLGEPEFRDALREALK